MAYHLRIIFALLLFSGMTYGCSTLAPDTGVTGRTIDCDGETRMIVDCKRTYKQYTRNMRVDIATIKKHAYGAGIGAKKLLKLDTVSGDLMAQQRQLCVDYNNCILTKEEYNIEAAFIRRAQMKIRHAATQMSSGPAGAMGGEPFGAEGSGGNGEGGDTQTSGSPSSFGQLLDGIVSGISSTDSDTSEETGF